MPFVSHNPATEAIIERFTSLTSEQIEFQLNQTVNAQKEWKKTSFEVRSQHLKKLNDLILKRKDELALIMTNEMGKPIKEARSEAEKCAQVCLYYAEQGAQFLQSEVLIQEENITAQINYFPLGVVFGVMPWNFPLWQIFRFAIPALMAGNAVVFKHAPNVPRSALAIVKLFLDTGFPEFLVNHLMIEDAQTNEVISSPHVQAVTVTGSERAGRAVASLAGNALKKCILELGGSDPFVVLSDADIEWTLDQAMASRYNNCGQACISAKRFIVVNELYEEFKLNLVKRVSNLVVGDPTDETTQIGPLARQDLRDQLAKQVNQALEYGATALTGGLIPSRKGWFYAPTVLENVTSSSPIWHQELFGPVAILIRAENENHAIDLANDTPYGLGSSIWSRDLSKARHLADQIEAGSTFVNALVRSDPRIPFGGTKQSGFGRELSSHGIREFTNIKTLWVKSL